MDFCQIRERKTKNGIEIFPDFVVRPSKDLMVRGGSFHAVWDEDAGLWSTNEYDVQRLLDAELYEHAKKIEEPCFVRTLGSYNSNMWKEFRSYIGNMPNSHEELDGTLTFADTPPRKGDHSSKRLPYSVKEGSIDAYDKLMSVLFAPIEREKLEWAVGSLISGDSKRIQKFFVLYGDAGTGKSTFLRILSTLFQGYETTLRRQILDRIDQCIRDGIIQDEPASGYTARWGSVENRGQYAAELYRLAREHHHQREVQDAVCRTGLMPFCSSAPTSR